MPARYRVMFILQSYLFIDKRNDGSVFKRKVSPRKRNEVNNVFCTDEVFCTNISNWIERHVWCRLNFVYWPFKKVFVLTWKRFYPYFLSRGYLDRLFILFDSFIRKIMKKVFHGRDKIFWGTRGKFKETKVLLIIYQKVLMF